MFMDGPPGKGLSRVKIIDFGCARRFNPNEKMTGMYGSAHYMAPEMQTIEYTSKVDVFSVGAILYLMAALKQPFQGATEIEILHKINYYLP